MHVRSPTWHATGRIRQETQDRRVGIDPTRRLRTMLNHDDPLTGPDSFTCDGSRLCSGTLHHNKPE